MGSTCWPESIRDQYPRPGSGMSAHRHTFASAMSETLRPPAISVTGAIHTSQPRPFVDGLGLMADSAEYIPERRGGWQVCDAEAGRRLEFSVIPANLLEREVAVSVEWPAGLGEP